MMQSKGKFVLRFLLFYGASYAVLLAVMIVHIQQTLPDVSYWKTHNPTVRDLIWRRNIPHPAPKAERQIRYHWVPLSRIPKLMQKSVIVAEDASFWVHHGVDWYELRRSFWRNWSRKKFSRGGSTITQQVAKNLYLSNRKSISRKIKEIFIARELDKKLSKRRILELYLNIAQWGKQIFGIEAASRTYFRKEPEYLFLSEMVRLAAVLPNPEKMHPNVLSRSVLWRTRVILRRLYRFSFIREEDYQDTLSEIDRLAGNTP